MYKGASEALINQPIEFNYYHGKNGMGNVEFWKPEYPSVENELVQPEHAAKIICDLVMKVRANSKIRFRIELYNVHWDNVIFSSSNFSIRIRYL